MYDNSKSGYISTASGTQTIPFLVGSNSNRAMGFFIRAFDGDRVTGVTYNGTSMSLSDKVQQGASSDYGYMYYLLNPDSGNNNIVVSLNPSTRISYAVISYYNIQQTGQPEAHNSAGGGGTSASLSMTSLTNGAFHVYGYVQNAGSTDSYTNVTERSVDNSNGTTGIGDSVKNPAGALTQSANWTGTQQYATCGIVLAPIASQNTEWYVVIS